MILMVVGVSVGGFITMSGIALAVITGRKGILAKLETGAAKRIAAALEFVASGAIILFGGILFFSQL